MVPELHSFLVEAVWKSSSSLCLLHLTCQHKEAIVSPMAFVLMRQLKKTYAVVDILCKYVSMVKTYFLGIKTKYNWVLFSTKIV